MNFVIDTLGEYNSEACEPSIETPTQAESESFVTQLLQEYKESIQNETKPKSQCEEKSIVEVLFEDMGWSNANATPRKHKKPEPVKLANNKEEVNQALEKSVVTADFEKLKAVPRFDVSEKKLKLERKKEGEKTKGKKWYGLPATEMTEEVKHDLEILQMRSVLDPKRFYKKNDLKVLPKYFQVGKVMDSPAEYYNARLTKKERKKTLVDELLADAEFSRYNKRKYKEIIEDKQKTHYKAWRQAKRLKKKK